MQSSDLSCRTCRRGCYPKNLSLQQLVAKERDRLVILDGILHYVDPAKLDICPGDTEAEADGGSPQWWVLRSLCSERAIRIVSQEILVEGDVLGCAQMLLVVEGHAIHFGQYQ